MNNKNENQLDFFRVRVLPDNELKPFWQNIIIDPKIKRMLLNHSLTTPKLDVQTKLECAIYGMVLLYGEPGTGKTSIALGCANEVAEKEFNSTGKKTKLLELNLNALFSEFLGKSVKGVTEAFTAVRLAARHGPVIVHLSEVESIAIDRSTLGSGDPSDVMRSVNAILTEIDELRYSKGVIIFATSNLTQKIDRAFWERSDLTIYLGPPNKKAARKIVERSFDTLRRFGITVAPEFYDAFVVRFYNNGVCKKFSGRTLSRLPMIALWMAGHRNLTTADVMYAADSLFNENGKEHNNGNFKEENGCWS